MGLRPLFPCVELGLNLNNFEVSNNLNPCRVPLRTRRWKTWSPRQKRLWTGKFMLHRFASASVRLPTEASEVGVPSVLTVLGVPESGAAKSRFTVFSTTGTGNLKTSRQVKSYLLASGYVLASSTVSSESLPLAVVLQVGCEEPVSGLVQILQVQD